MPSKLRLHKETLKVLGEHSSQIAGGATYATCVCSDACLTKQNGTFCQTVTVVTLLASCGGLC